MTKTQWQIVGCLTVAVLLVSVAGAAAFLLTRVPAVSQQLPPNADPILITILNPPNQSRYPENGFVPVQAIIRSQQPIVLMELWVDGALVETKTPDPGADLTRLTVRWSWPPRTKGEYALVVRVKDATGRIGTSNVVRVATSPPVGADIVYTAKAGDTVDAVASKFNASKQDIVNQNPKLGSNAVITVGQTITIPIPPFQSLPPVMPASPAPPEGTLQPVSMVEPNGLSFWAAKLSSSAILPQAPALAVNVQGCNVNLVIADKSDDEQGFFVYRVEPGGSAFHRIATLAANSGALPLQYGDANVAGKTQYYVSAYNAAGEAKSNLVHVEIKDPACQSSQSSSNLKFENGKLTVPTSVTLAYVYASIKPGVYERIPTDPKEFLKPVNGVVDLLASLDKLVAASGQSFAELDLDAWGWQANTLVELGKLHVKLEHTDFTICKLGTNCTGDVQGGFRDTKDSIASDQPNQIREFYWGTNAPGTTSALWQISISPFASGFELKPAGLIASDDVPGSSSGGAYASGSFKVDFAAIAKAQTSSSQPTPAPTQPASKYWLSQFTGMNPNLALLNQINLPTKFYARLTPMSGNQPSGEPAKTIVIDYGPKGPPPTIDYAYSFPPNIYDVQIVKFTPIQPATLRWGCVIVKNVDPQASTFKGFGNMWLPMFNNLASSGAPYCPKGWKGMGEKSWWEQLWDFVSGGLSWAAEAFNDLKDLAVGFAANLIPGCSGTDVCTGALKIGLDIGLTSLGIPPELPNLDQLTNEGMGYLVDVAAQQLPAGDVCGDLCKDQLAKGISNLADQVAQQTVARATNTDEAHNHGAEPLWLPAGVTAVPAPGSVTQPASVEIKVTRKPLPAGTTPADPKRYRLVITVEGVNETVTGATFSTALCFNDNGDWPCDPVSVQVTPPLKGTLFNRVDAPLPEIAVGESKTIKFLLTPSEYWLPEHGNPHDFPAKFPSESYVYNDWQYLYPGGKANVKAGIQCQGAWAPCGATTEGTFSLPSSYW